MPGVDTYIRARAKGGRKSRTIPRKDLADVLEARSEEVLSLIANDLRLSGHLPMLGSGLVLTGGASQLEGLVEMGEFIFDVPVRRGQPGKVGGLTDVVRSGESAVAVGLLLYAFEEKKDTMNLGSEMHQLGESLDGLARKVKDFFGSMF
jgi:cell division protein FtsA